MMHLVNEITIDGDLETIFHLGSDIERWPEILPHYRKVEVLSRSSASDEVEAKMAAWRGRIPVSWTCRQRFDPLEPHIRFEHIGGFTRGMQVSWTFEPHPDGRVTVRIEHEFQKGWPLLDDFVSDRIVGQFFVSAIAGKTLERVKHIAERQRKALHLAGQA